MKDRDRKGGHYATREITGKELRASGERIFETEAGFRVSTMDTDIKKSPPCGGLFIYSTK